MPVAKPKRDPLDVACELYDRAAEAYQAGLAEQSLLMFE